MMEMRDMRAACDGHAGMPYPTLLVTVLTPPPRPGDGIGSLVLCPTCVVINYRSCRLRRPS